MILRSCLAFVLLLSSLAYAQALPAGEYAKHFLVLEELSVAVANAMPADQYGFKPHPESMDFGTPKFPIKPTAYRNVTRNAR